MSKQQIKFGIQFIQIGGITLMTVKLRYAVGKLSNDCVNDIYNFRESMNLMYNVKVSVTQGKYITLEFACNTNNMVLHELQHLQYDIARRRLDRRFAHMHQFAAAIGDTEAAAYDTIITENGTHYWLHKPEGIEF
jgi:hypothetical protein